jgi:hypothetical protein
MAIMIQLAARVSCFNIVVFDNRQVSLEIKALKYVSLATAIFKLGLPTEF